MKSTKLAALGFALGALLACASASFAQANDPLSVLQHYYDARSRGDLAGAMSVVAPDATYTTGPCAPVCSGTAQIQQRELEPSMANGGQYTAVNARVSGTTVTLQLEVRNKITKQAGIDRFLNDISAEVQDGKIVAYKAATVTSDPQTAAYLAFTRSQAAGQTPPAQTPAALVSPPLLLLAGGVVVVAAGLVLRVVLRRRKAEAQP